MARPAAPRTVVTLTTDFGAGSPYVAAMKGVLLGTAPDATLVDISHAVPAFDLPLPTAGRNRYRPGPATPALDTGEGLHELQRHDVLHHLVAELVAELALVEVKWPRPQSSGYVGRHPV